MLREERRLVILFDSVDEMERTAYLDNLTALSEFARRNVRIRSLFFRGVRDITRFWNRPRNLDSWLRRVVKARNDPVRQSALLQAMSNLSSELAPQHWLDHLVRLDTDADREPAASEYWRARHDLECRTNDGII